jgi:hypothetical protein
VTDNRDTQPMIIDPSSVPGQVFALARYMLASFGSFALGRGWIDGDALQFLTGLLTVAAPAAYGVWKAWSNKRKLVIVAEAAPDSVAQVK